MLFFYIAPLFGFPSTWDESASLALIVTPVFLGNIGFAAAYAAQREVTPSAGIGDERLRLMGLLYYGAVMAFVLIITGSCAAFWISNRQHTTTTGLGMSLQGLQIAIGGALSLSSITSNYLMTSIFPLNDKPQKIASQ
jgi:hypothetical protein